MLDTAAMVASIRGLDCAYHKAVYSEMTARRLCGWLSLISTYYPGTTRIQGLEWKPVTWYRSIRSTRFHEIVRVTKPKVSAAVRLYVCPDYSRFKMEVQKYLSAFC